MKAPPNIVPIKQISSSQSISLVSPIRRTLETLININPNFLLRRVGLALAFVAITLGFASTSHAQIPKGYFHLTTNFVEGKGLALEGGNGNGPAHLARKGNFPGQLWKAVPAEAGYFYLTTKLMEGKGFALEGGDGSGPAHLAKKGKFTGQLWKAIPEQGGYFYLTTNFVEGKGLALEGGDGKRPPHLAKKGNVSGQAWKAIPQAVIVNPNQGLRSGGSGKPVVVQFINGTGGDIELCWIDHKGVEHRYGKLKLGEKHDQQTGAGHVWRAKWGHIYLGTYTATEDLRQQHIFRIVPQQAQRNPNQGLRSRVSGKPVVVQFINGTGGDIELCWIDPKGVEHRYGKLKLGEKHDQQTEAGNVWRAKWGHIYLGTYTATEDLKQQHTFRIVPQQAQRNPNHSVGQNHFRQNRVLKTPINLFNPDYGSIHLAIALVTNEIRAKHGKRKLKISPNLTAAARMHASDMVSNNFFNHENLRDAAKRNPNQRATMHGVTNPTIAENIARGFATQYVAGEPISPGQKFPPHTPLSMADDLLKSWMKSPGHRNNILSDNALSIGCGAQLKLTTDPPDVYAVQKFQLYNPIKVRGQP